MKKEKSHYETDRYFKTFVKMLKNGTLYSYLKYYIKFVRKNVKKNSKILDLGCGYGPVGISIAKSFPETKVLMTDVNKRAIKLAKMSIELNKTANVETKCSDKFEKIDQNFDTILLNPPQTAGKKLCFEMIEESKSHLERNGLLQLVARHNKGGKDLSKKMNEVFGNVKETAKGSGYRIYVSEKTN